MYKKFGCQRFHATLKYSNDKYSQIVVYDNKCIVKNIYASFFLLWFQFG